MERGRLSTPRKPASRRSRPISARSTVVIANAGITRDAPFHKMTPEQWYGQVIDTNLTGVFNTVHPVWPGMRERKLWPCRRDQLDQRPEGSVGAGELCRDQVRRYRHRALAGSGRCSARGITANAVCPGYIATEMVHGRSRRRFASQSSADPRWPPWRAFEEIARCVAFLASDDAGFINGSTISANGAQFFG